ncbi:MAG: hypothetical protein U9O94_01330 [Nanoarchaeota archaeon]|nr:hypothetical protein [Nanoarchaeota archaeon]
MGFWKNLTFQNGLGASLDPFELTPIGKNSGEGEESYRPPPPAFYDDANFRRGQDYTMGMGTDIMRGDIPSYYRPVGEVGSPEFEAMLGKTKADISQGATEALAKGGRARGGQLAASTASAISDASITARFDDYSRAMKGKMGLLDIGNRMVSGARDAGLRYAGDVNEYNWKQYDTKMGWYNYDQGLQREKDQARGKMYGEIGSMAQQGWNAWQNYRNRDNSGGFGGITDLGFSNTGYDAWGNPMSVEPSYSNTGYDAWGNPMSVEPSYSSNLNNYSNINYYQDRLDREDASIDSMFDQQLNDAQTSWAY